mmetsp:Transcript_49944/g.107488  ORF Transcript_49944/g.107488 Transcript_49944/m.107488 type:complete len:188 (+) Transcript_49944:97-660(+)
MLEKFHRSETPRNLQSFLEFLIFAAMSKLLQLFGVPRPVGLTLGAKSDEGALPRPSSALTWSEEVSCIYLFPSLPCPSLPAFLSYPYPSFPPFPSFPSTRERPASNSDNWFVRVGKFDPIFVELQDSKSFMESRRQLGHPSSVQRDKSGWIWPDSEPSPALVTCAFSTSCHHTQSAAVVDACACPIF